MLHLLIPLLFLLFISSNISNGKQLVISKPKVLVIGGSGRVGGSAVRAIQQRYGDSISLFAGGRREQSWQQLLQTKKELVGKSIQFQQVDITDQINLRRVIENYDVIINTAGPFQGVTIPTVLETSLQLGKIYLDVCDDISLSRIARSSRYQTLAKNNKGTAIISTGIWPGCSSLLAEEVIDKNGGHSEVDQVKFTFFTAGSGGAGPTILSATFLILGEDVVTYVNGKEVLRKSATDSEMVDFGPSIGIREVARLNLIECESCHQQGVDSVETFFGTAPPIWNKLFVLMANLIPQDVLKNRKAMTALANVSLPMVRLVDKLVGAKNGKPFIIY